MNFKTRRIEPVPPSSINYDTLGFNFIPTKKMFVSVFEDGRWNDLGLRPLGEFSIHPAAGALHYGQSLFEGLKARLTPGEEIVLFRPDDNARRMADGCRRLMMPVYEEHRFVEAVVDTVLANKEYIPPPDKGALYIRPVMFAHGPILGVRPATEFMFIVFVSPVGPYFKEGFKPIRLKVLKDFHRAPAGGVGCVKAAGNYVSGMYPATLAKKEGFAEVLYLDTSNRHFEEVGAANFFLRKGNRLATPALKDKSILPGFTRSSVLQLARDEGLDVTERDVMLEEIHDADEAFCTGTAAVITPIGSVNVDDNDVVIADGQVGKYARLFYDQLNAVMVKDIKDKHGWVVTIGKK